MGVWMMFLLGCWLGCIVGFLVAGLTSASRLSETVSPSHTAANQVSISGVLAEEVVGFTAQ